MPMVNSIADFLDTVRKSGVVESQALEGLLQQLRTAGTLPEEPRGLAVQLIRGGLLTPFQARFLLVGKWRNLLLAGKYKLLELIGAGGMGNVYRAEHIFMRRKVAVKVLPTHLTEYPSAIQRFYREARAVAALDHPNIVRAHDVDREGHLHFIVMEYVDGISLQELVKQHGPLPWGRAVHYICQAAAGLQHAHEAGWVHRDVKPGNMLVDRQNAIKILDLGLARLFDNENDQLTKQHEGKTLLGTADYLAPEQALSGEVDIRSDIYSLGCSLYYLLAGHPPFPKGTTSQKLLAHQMEQPTPIREIRFEISVGLAAVLERMMEKAPDHRYSTPAEVLEELLPYAQIQPLNSLTGLTLNLVPPSAGGSLSGFTGGSSKITLNPTVGGSPSEANSTSRLQVTQADHPNESTGSTGTASSEDICLVSPAGAPRAGSPGINSTNRALLLVLLGAFLLGSGAAALLGLLFR
jgi:serine/threonine protein kinase